MGSGKSSGSAGQVLRDDWEADPGRGKALGITRESFRGMGKSPWEKRLKAILVSWQLVGEGHSVAKLAPK